MIHGARADAALQKLLKLARQSADEASLRLADLEKAKASAETSVAALAETIRKEEIALSSEKNTENAQADLQLMTFTEATRDRREALRHTIETLADEIVVARKGLSEAMTEVSKLDHLIDVSAKARRKTERKRAQKTLDEAARVAVTS